VDYATLNSYQLRDGIIDVVEVDVWTREHTAAAQWPPARCCGCGLEGAAQAKIRCSDSAALPSSLSDLADHMTHRV
jgi:hypothetical protein